MKNPDEAIERVLTSMRDAEGPAGMEARILRTLETHDLRGASRVRSGWRKKLQAWSLKTSPYYLLASLAMASLLIVALAVHSTRQAKEDPSRSQPAAVTLASIPASSSGTLQTVAPKAIRGRSLRGRTVRSAVQFEIVSAEDALALSELLAPSKPAPPLPLTHQEVLLAQVVHHGDPEELAELRPEVREKQVEIAKAEFHKFFEPRQVEKNNEKPKL